ncbi:peptidase M36 [Chytridium lagenaria]|nr:peptidase M36 [Chytridium lagenaria]
MLAGQSTFVDPSLKDASPLGWQSSLTAAGEYQTTGNNLRAVYQTVSGPLGVSRQGGQFNYPYNITADPSTTGNVAAAMANTFFVSNMYHDVMYRYGFTEQFANFQNNNFGRGGFGNDGVLAIVQASDGLNNANFATPADGSPGRMRMYIWDITNPRLDSDLDNGVIIHELSHGLSNRLTGGLGNGACLQILQSRGMGEGWSDTVAWWSVMKPTDTSATEKTVGHWLFNDYNKGIRRYPYTTNMARNPNTYNQLATLTRVHDIGDVWSTMMYEVYWSMLDSLLFETDITNSGSQKGNIRFMKNFVDSLKLQGCNPTLIAARNGFIQADKINNGGKFVCAIWRAFAKRGLGVGATQNFADNNQLGDSC